MFVKKNFVFDKNIALALEMLADDENMTQTALIKALVRERLKKRVSLRDLRR
jgi:hypothetical protein